ncbi:MAG: hypothetical protein KBC42_00925 [Candidatus Pacebacteria bacterium]|nr:hypothetical protein [Candidatus Paceibacterota bacterium]MBP9780472.1 hypothetical protein [Candidatus Paceibacterota bacterium]MDQ5962132.1 hypothetical protein [Patescibacteria group bacterium]
MGKKITLTELCAQTGVLIEDSDLNDTNFPPVEESTLGRQLMVRTLMDHYSTEDILESICRAKVQGAAGPADIFDLLSTVAKENRSDYKTKIDFVAFGSPYIRYGKEYYPCLTIKDDKAVLTLEHNEQWKAGYVVKAKMTKDLTPEQVTKKSTRTYGQIDSESVNLVLENQIKDILSQTKVDSIVISGTDFNDSKERHKITISVDTTNGMIRIEKNPS